MTDARRLRRAWRALVWGATSLSLAGCEDEGASPATCDPPPAADAAWFVDRTDASGVAFTHHPTTPLCHITDTVGGPGVCAFDADGDADLELYFVDRAGSPSRLFRNDGGTFVDVTDAAGVGAPGDAIGCAAFDAEGDGDVDLLVTTTGRDTLYRNDGAGRFADVSVEAGLDAEAYSTSATVADVDLDGDLDLFVARLVDLETCPDECYLFPLACQAVTNALYVNDGAGHFVDEAAARGLDHADPSLAALFYDHDDDGDPDLWVGNDMGIAFPDRLYVNDGAGRFVDRGEELGYAAAGTDTMGGDVGDVHGDGLFDLVSTDFDARPTRYIDCFDRQYACSFDSLPPESTAWVNWGIGLVDFDLDGDLDVFQASGDVFDPEFEGSENQLFVREDGRWRTHVPAPGEALTRRAVHRGAVFGDLDGDLDVDVAVAVAGGSPQILTNVSPVGHGVRVVTRPVLPGTRVVVTAGGRRQTEQVLLGGSYLGTGDPRVTFGIGDACEADVEVRFPDGTVRTAQVGAGEEVVIAR